MAIPKTSYSYDFSFVMPVYNAENYLAETVESILAQSVDFQERCEIIFVNDGSSDASEEVCLRYKEQFPNNITYIKQDNAGVCAARNRGLKDVRGKYVSFLDSDDKLSPNTLEEVYDFFERHHDEVDVVSIKLEFFEARTGEHPLNYKFDSSRVIDIKKEYESVQLSAATAFVKAETIQRGNHTFDPTAGRYGEDAKFITEIILEKNAYGVVSKPTYYYRKHVGGGSSLDGTLGDKFWYLETPRRIFLHLMEYSKDAKGSIPRYIQYLVMYDLQWRLRQRHQAVLNAREEKEYKDILRTLLLNIDDDIIMAQKVIKSEHKLFALSMKHGKDVLSSAVEKDGNYYFGATAVYDYNRTHETVFLELVEVEEGALVIEGYATGFLFDDKTMQFESGGRVFPIQHVDRPLKYVTFLDQKIFDRNCFKVEIPLTDHTAVMAYIVGDGFRKKMRIHPVFSSRFSSPGSYRKLSDYIVTLAGHSIFVQKRQLTTEVIRELKRAKGLARRKRVGSIFMRLLAMTYGKVLPGKVWLISDRIAAAGDNGEALFRYISKARRSDGVRAYFAVSKSSDDYARMKRCGKVVNHDGFYYKLLFLLSDKIISSHADIMTINAFGDAADDFVDMYRYDFVFLQHGITQGDLSSWLNRYNKNIKLLVTAAKPEYDSIVNGDYGYDETVIKLLGFPRYDNLKNAPKNRVVIAPTWRKHLVTGNSATNRGNWDRNDYFKSTEYYKFYQGLLNDERVHDALRATGMKMDFYLHPAMRSQLSDFEANDFCEIKKMPYDYGKAFTEGTILLTDYSSVAFDFAYLKKPVLYAHFDKAKFYAAHLYDSGYFSYEDHGFGPVAYDYEETVRQLVSLIKTNGQLSKKYEERVEKFFYKFDTQNAKRVYEAILDIK